jgi:hypothetical protein
VLLAATYLMNTWSAWAAGSAPGVVLHSVPPLVVVIAAEALTDLQYALSTCAQHAAQRRTEPPVPAQDEHPLLNTHPDQSQAPVTTPRPASLNSPPSVSPNPPVAFVTTPRVASANTPEPRSMGHPRRTRRAAPAARSRTAGTAGAPRRKLLADYLAEAQAAFRPGVVISPAWVRQVTDCSRGLSSKVAATLNTTLNTDAAGTAPTTTTTRIDSEGRAA